MLDNSHLKARTSCMWKTPTVKGCTWVHSTCTARTTMRSNALSCPRHWDKPSCAFGLFQEQLLEFQFTQHTNKEEHLVQDHQATRLVLRKNIVEIVCIRCFEIAGIVIPTIGHLRWSIPTIGQSECIPTVKWKFIGCQIQRLNSLRVTQHVSFRRSDKIG